MGLDFENARHKMICMMTSALLADVIRSTGEMCHIGSDIASQ